MSGLKIEGMEAILRVSGENRNRDLAGGFAALREAEFSALANWGACYTAAREASKEPADVAVYREELAELTFKYAQQGSVIRHLQGVIAIQDREIEELKKR